MFVGTHERSLDEKGRLSLPSSFRNQLGERCYLVNMGDSLGLYPEHEFAETVSRLDAKVRAGEASQDALRRFTASAYELKVDSQGRIVLPSARREPARIEDEIVLIGVNNRIEIHRPSSWQQLSEPDDDFAADRSGSWL